MDMQQMEEFKTMFTEILNEEAHYPEIARLVLVDGSGDEIDVANEEKSRQLDLRLRSRNTIYLKKVKYAMDKIHDGTFGTCEECGCEIGMNRLRARPTATLCIGCKELEERDERQLVNGNRHSAKFGNVLPIKSVESGWGQSGEKKQAVVAPETSSYSDVVDF